MNLENIILREKAIIGYIYYMILVKEIQRIGKSIQREIRSFFSRQSDEIVLKLIVVVLAKVCEHTMKHCIGHLKWSDTK